MINTPRLLLLTSVAAVALGASPSIAVAGPQGGQTVAGSANISQNGTKTDIHQHSNKAILDWRSFDVTAQEHVEFHQPSSGAIALNRINDAKASQIDGRLTANGHVMLINPNGVVFGASSQVDVGSLTATTADIDNNDFMAGRLDFKQAGNLDAAIVNHGSITVKEMGLVNFVAPRVENHGVIHAKLGKVQLAAADTFAIDMAGDGLLQVAITDEQAQKLSRNTGRITAEGGMVALTATHARSIVDSLVDNSGIIEAHSMTKVGGKIILGGANTKVFGTLNANGKTGGGEILIGGDYQGKAIENVQNAKITEVSNTAVITANATDQGHGGKVIVWADGATRFEGVIEAKGGTNSGDGGFVEVSGKKYLEYAGDVDLRGDNLGTLLLDPDDIDIVAGVANPGEFADDLIAFSENGGGTSTLSADTLSGRLSANANVILQANNTIDVNAAINSTGSGDLTLETGAGGTITVNNAINVNTGDLTLKADEIDIFSSLSGSGDIQLTSADVTQEIEIGSTDAADLNLTATELAFLQDGWNQITLGSNTHTGRIDITDAISFSDHVNFLNTSNDATITVQDVFITTGNANATFESGSAGNVGWDAINIDADMNVAGDLITRSGAGGGAGHVDINNTNFIVGGDWIVLSDNNGDFVTTNLNVGGNIVTELGSANTDYDFTATNALVGGDFTIDAEQSIDLSGDWDVAGFIDFSNQMENDINIAGNITSGSIINISGAANIEITGDLTSNGDITIGADNDANHNGAVSISGSTIATNGGDLTLGGGVNPLTTAAHAGQDGVYDIGVELNGATITTGTGNISIRGEGEDTGTANYGVYLRNSSFTATSGALTVAGTGGIGASSRGINSSNSVLTVTDGDMNLNGTSVSSAEGIRFAATNLISNGLGLNAGKIDVTGSVGVNGSGLVFQSGSNDITSVNGDISIAGTSGSLAGLGIVFRSGTSISSTGTSANAANISINGTSIGLGGNSLIGVSLDNTDITTSAGDIILTGQGSLNAGGIENYGVLLQTGSTITSSGTGVNAGTITLNGIGGDGTDDNYGVYLTSTGTTIDSIDGAINITGQGGSNGGADSDNNYGVFVGNGADVISTGTGINAATITLDGTGGAGEDNNEGVYLYLAGTTVTSVDGDILITGVGSSNGTATSDNNDGILLNGSASIHSTGITTNAAKITLRGTGGNGQRFNRGVVNAGLITSAYGDIDIVGIGSSNSSASSNGNYGFHAGAGGDVISTGTGLTSAKITLNGTGGAGDDDNYGVFLAGTGTTIDSIDGNISIIGQGGSNGGADSHNNYGVFVQTAAEITSQGTGVNAGNIDIIGNGGNGDDFNHGVFVNSSASISSTSGAIDLTGTAFGTGGLNQGIYLLTLANIQNDSGSINLNGTASINSSAGNNIGIGTNASSSVITNSGNINITGTSNSGIALDLRNGGTEFKSTSGDISVLGTTTSAQTAVRFGNADVFSDGSSNITIEGNSSLGTDILLDAVNVGEDTAGSLMSGNITIIADDWDFDETNSTIETLGDVIFQNRTAGTNIGLGGGAGDLNITDAELAQFSVGGDLTIGSLNAGLVSIDSADFTTATTNAIQVSGGDITIDGGTDAGNSILLTAANTITLNGSVTATGANDSIVLASNGFTNTGGANALNAGAGRFLVYASSPDTVQKGGIIGSDIFLTTYPQSIAASFGDSFVFESFDPSFSLPTTVEYQIQAPDYSLQNNVGLNVAYADNDLRSNSKSSDDKSQSKPIIRRVNGIITASSSTETDAGVSLVEANLMEIEQPIIDFYELCSYNAKYCQ